MSTVLVIIVCVLLFVIYNNNTKNSDTIADLKKTLEEERISRDLSFKQLSEESERTIDILQFRIKELESSLEIANQNVLQLKNEKNLIQKKLDIFTNIEKDSMLMNSSSNERVEEWLIDRIKEERVQNNTKFVPRDIQEKVPTEEAQKDDVGNSSIFSEKLDDEQRTALNLMEYSTQNIFITGKAGTGKSFLLNAFYRTTAKKVLKLAPTGIAALNVEGATIHSAFGFDNLEKVRLEELSKKTLKLSGNKQLLLRSIDTLVIDEISMVRADTLDKIEWILRLVTGNSIPFGGKQVVLFGDLFQLPPVAKPPLNIELRKQYGGIHFFYSNAYHYGNFRFIELTINHRQKKDIEFFELLNRIREGTYNRNDIDDLNSRYTPNADSLSRTILTLYPTKNAAEEKNTKELGKIQGEEYCYTAEIIDSGMKISISKIDGLFPITSKLYLKVGAAIMMVVNDPEKRWVNGTLGIVKRLTENRIFVVINGIQYEISKSKFTLQEAVLIDGEIEYVDTLSVIQYPLVLAYAITIHKSQGMTYESIACDVNNCFAAGQAYVALSRCSSMNGLHLTNLIQPDSIQVDNAVIDFYKSQQIRCK